MKKIIVLLIVLVLLGTGIYIYTKKEAKAPTDNNVQSQSQNQNTGQNQAQSQSNPSATPTPTTQTNVKGGIGPDYTPPGQSGENIGPDIQVYAVDFNGTAFTPAAVNIKVNDWVFFKNNSASDFWPASNPHPTHTDYPAFDALKRIAPGGQYKFQFTKAGSWGYHNHLTPDIGGTVNVAQ